MLTDKAKQEKLHAHLLEFCRRLKADPNAVLTINGHVFYPEDMHEWIRHHQEHVRFALGDTLWQDPTVGEAK